MSILEINLDPDTKSLAVAGDKQMIHEIIKDIYTNSSR